VTILNGKFQILKTMEFFVALAATIAFEAIIAFMIYFNYIQSKSLTFEMLSNSGTLINLSSTLLGFLVTALALIEAFFPKEQLRNVRESGAAPSIPGFFLLTIATLFFLLLLSLFIKFTGANSLIFSLITLFFLLFSLSSLTISLLAFGMIIKQVHMGDPPDE